MKLSMIWFLGTLIFCSAATSCFAQGGKPGGNRQGRGQGRDAAAAAGVGVGNAGAAAANGGAAAGQGNCPPMQNANAGELSTVAQAMLANYDADGNGALDLGELQRALGGLQAMMMQNQGNRMAMAAGNGMMDPSVVTNDRSSRNQRMLNAGNANAGGANSAPVRVNGGRGGGRK